MFEFFTLDLIGWTQAAELFPPGGVSGDDFGVSVDLSVSDSGSLAIVGSPARRSMSLVASVLFVMYSLVAACRGEWRCVHLHPEFWSVDIPSPASRIRFLHAKPIWKCRGDLQLDCHRGFSRRKQWRRSDVLLPWSRGWCCFAL